MNPSIVYNILHNHSVHNAASLSLLFQLNVLVSKMWGSCQIFLLTKI